ncbi:hypothetical protein [Chengkuizengella marina]|uniref:Uncharacterized protein n=1 Tax=Chengkuizengella marina TaxID=2507566 RepID=A0A6N9Q2R7_9BACL|nr:hypothetical protein [Chengkuizengella marina]NBI29048.1 hypothetical protein [Chengkuizengella marina]
MDCSLWLRGGPFLEVSFLLELKGEKKNVIKTILNKLSKSHNQIEVVDKKLDDMIESFVKGYPYDEEDPHTIQIHSMKVKLYVHVAGRRKAILFIEQVSSNALLINFCFFGCEFDAPEWGQKGLKVEDLPNFTNFLTDLYCNFQFKIGGIAIEKDILDLFNCNEVFPNECYRFENINLNQFLETKPYFIYLLWNENYKKLVDIPYNHKRINKLGLLITISDSYSEF